MSKTEIKSVKARVRNLAFISEEDAAWLAVRTLIAATAIKVDFQYYYFCVLMTEARNSFLRHGIRDHLWPAPGMSLLHFENEVRKAVEYTTLSKERVTRDVVVLGNVFGQMFGQGLGKVAAIKKVESIYAKSAHQLIKSGEHKVAKNFKKLGDRTISGLWTQYESVLPYVYELSLNLRASASNIPLRLDIAHLNRAPWDFLTLISEIKSTRPTKIKQLQYIEFT